MRAVIQRVRSAKVSMVDQGQSTKIGSIDIGLLVLVGVRTDDTAEEAQWLADKIAGLRIFEDSAGKMNLSLQEVGGSILLVSNFTLYADCRKGRRPSFSEAASGPAAQVLYELVGELLVKHGIPLSRGAFGAEMMVTLVNDGPVTLVIDTPDRPRLDTAS